MITSSYKKAVKEQDAMTLRVMMKNSMLVDSTFAELDAMIKLAGDNYDVPGLYDEFDGRELSEDKADWNNNYMDKLMSQLVGNFCSERINHLKKVVAHLRRSVKPPPPPPPPPPPKGDGSTGQNTGGRPPVPPIKESNRNKKIAGAAIGGGVIGGTIAGVAGGTILIGVAAGAVIAGALAAITTNNE